jgi:hypothetical protein
MTTTMHALARPKAPAQREPISTPRGAALLVGLAGLLVSFALAEASDVCVVCEDPPASYRCEAEGQPAGGPTPDGLPIRCVTELAKRGPHGRCRIDKTKVGAATCLGTLVIVTAPPPALAPHGALPTPTAGPANAALPTGAPPSPNQAAPTQATPDQPVAPKQPPQTVEALAKEAARQSKETVADTTEAAKKAGSAVGNAMRRSWECLSSLFSRC